MQPVTLKELEWIHDCVLLAMTYDATDPDGRAVTWTLRCPTDLGYPPWDGKELALVAVDVALLRHFAWGVDGRETVSAVNAGISSAAQESTMDARRAGVRFPEVEFTIGFGSGSYAEVICREVRIEVREG